MSSIAEWRERLLLADKLPAAERRSIAEEACREFPGDAYFRAVLVAELNEHDPKRASAIARAALDLEMDEPEVAYALAESLFFQEEYEDAARALRLARRAAGEDLTADLGGRMSYMFGRLAGLKAQEAEMLELFELAIQYEPSSVRYVLTLAAVFTEMQRLPEAIAVLEEAQSHAPDHPSVRAELEELRRISAGD